MSLTVSLALCILGLDLLIYVLFHRIYGDKRIAVARQVAAFKGQSPRPSRSLQKRPFMDPRSRSIEDSAQKRTAPANSQEWITIRFRKRRSVYEPILVAFDVAPVPWTHEPHLFKSR